MEHVDQPRVEIDDSPRDGSHGDHHRDGVVDLCGFHGLLACPHGRYRDEEWVHRASHELGGGHHDRYHVAHLHVLNGDLHDPPAKDEPIGSLPLFAPRVLALVQLLSQQ